MAKRRLTRVPERRVFTSVYFTEHDRTLLYSAALQLGISQSEALRRAVRTFATDVLLRAEPPAREAEAAR